MVIVHRNMALADLQLVGQTTKWGRSISPDVSMRSGMFWSFANLNTFSSLATTPSGLICRTYQIQQLYANLCTVRKQNKIVCVAMFPVFLLARMIKPRFFFLEYARELHIIALRRGKGQNSQVTHTTTHPRHTPPPQPLGGSQFEKKVTCR